MKSATFPGAARATRRMVRDERAIRRAARDRMIRSLLNEPASDPVMDAQARACGGTATPADFALLRVDVLTLLAQAGGAA